MARSFHDIGSSIFGFFFGPDDYFRSLAISTTAGPTSFAVARDNKDDNNVETYLTVNQELSNPVVSKLSFSTSDASNPSVSVESDALKNKHISMSSTLSDPNLSLNVEYNDEDKYSLSCSLNTNFETQRFEAVNICAAYDSLLNKNLLVGANFNLSNEEQPNEMTYSFGLEYQHSERLSFGVLARDNLQKFDVGLMLDKFRGSEANTLFAKVSAEVDTEHKPEIDYAVGLNYAIDEDSCFDFIVNKNNTVNMRYSVNNCRDENAAFMFHAFVASHLDFNHDVAKKAKLQYGVSIE